MFKNRSIAKELMDDPLAEEGALHQNLGELRFINTWLGGYAVTLQALNRLLTEEVLKANPKRIWRIADIGSGGGDMLLAICKWANKRKIAVHLIGIDKNPSMISYAAQFTSPYINISYKQADVLAADFELLQYDIAVCNLFCHHLTNSELQHLLPVLQRQSLLGFVINDLHRHPFAYYSIKWLSAAFSRSPLLRHDAPLSVLRSFTKKELTALFRQSGIYTYTLHWRWAFRWQLVVHK